MVSLALQPYPLHTLRPATTPTQRVVKTDFDESVTQRQEVTIEGKTKTQSIIPFATVEATKQLPDNTSFIVSTSRPLASLKKVAGQLDKTSPGALDAMKPMDALLVGTGAQLFINQVGPEKKHLPNSEFIKRLSYAYPGEHHELITPSKTYQKLLTWCNNQKAKELGLPPVTDWDNTKAFLAMTRYLKAKGYEPLKTPFHIDRRTDITAPKEIWVKSFSNNAPLAKDPNHKTILPKGHPDKTTIGIFLRSDNDIEDAQGKPIPGKTTHDADSTILVAPLAYLSSEHHDEKYYQPWQLQQVQKDLYTAYLQEVRAKDYPLSTGIANDKVSMPKEKNAQEAALYELRDATKTQDRAYLEMGPSSKEAALSMSLSVLHQDYHRSTNRPSVEKVVTLGDGNNDIGMLTADKVTLYKPTTKDASAWEPLSKHPLEVYGVALGHNAKVLKTLTQKQYEALAQKGKFIHSVQGELPEVLKESSAQIVQVPHDDAGSHSEWAAGIQTMKALNILG